MKAGVHKYVNVPANQFSLFSKTADGQTYARALTTDNPKVLSAWKWGYPVGAGEYASLYPRSWFTYRDPATPVEATVEQFSPILPNNYKETSYPVAIYQWKIKNTGNQPVTAAVMFSWSNMIGWFRDGGRDFANGLSHQNTNAHRTTKLPDGRVMHGIVFDRVRNTPVTEEWDGQFAIAAVESPGVKVSYHTTFSPWGTGEEVWTPFSTNGELSNDDLRFASSGELLAGAIAVKVELKPGEEKEFPIVLSWDLPVIEFGGGRKWNRRYTDFFGTRGTNAWEIAKTGILNGPAWEKQIADWQAKYADDASKPLWYRGMLFNELYIVADGGTVWARERDKPRPVGTTTTFDGQTFSFLECFDYPYYGTLDVLFYGSMPVVKFWPELDKIGVTQFGDTVDQDLPMKYAWQWKSLQAGKPVFRERKVKGSLPHDLGTPAEDPFIQVNQFSWQNTNRWKDLNTKFVLMVWRDFYLDGKKDLAFLKRNYPSAKKAMQYLLQFDTNHDGVIENEGYPDQTYDTWVTHGESAYSGGLYLAALKAMVVMAKQTGDFAAASSYNALFTKAQASYIKKLWNGTYFNYDVGSPYHDNVMADQLAGQWYANLSGLGDVVPKDMRLSALKKIFHTNVMKFHDGMAGALNGMGADGQILDANEQIGEVWVGTTFALAGELMAEGLRDEAFQTAKGIHHVVYVDKGYWFRTPEAWDSTRMYRASMYMRPGAIWSMEMVPTTAPTTAAAK
jgi:non-lysosomal glucosylceramidase